MDCNSVMSLECSTCKTACALEAVSQVSAMRLCSSGITLSYNLVSSAIFMSWLMFRTTSGMWCSGAGPEPAADAVT